MITTPLLTNAEGKQRWPCVIFGLSCVALATLCWITFVGTKSFPDLQEIAVGPATQPGETWEGHNYPWPINSKGHPLSKDIYIAEFFGGQIETLNEYKVWKTPDDGMTVYHGSNSHVIAKPQPKDYQGIWFSPDFACAMGAGTNVAKSTKSKKEYGDVTIVEYLLKNSVACKPFLLLGTGAKNNAKILFENDFKAPKEETGFITMGRGSQDISKQLASFCTNVNYCGWRSPFDQNEVFICNKCMEACLHAKQSYYKIKHTDLPPYMDEIFWFPNQAPIDTVNDYLVDGVKDHEAGEAARENGDTLAYYAYAPHKHVQDGIKDGSSGLSLPKGKKDAKKELKPSSLGTFTISEEDCDEAISPSVLLNDDQTDMNQLSAYSCSSTSAMFMFPIAEGLETISEEEPTTPKSKPTTPKSEPKTPKGQK